MTTYSAFTDSGHQLCTGVDINEVMKIIPAGSRLHGGATETKTPDGVIIEHKAKYKCMNGTTITVTIDEKKGGSDAPTVS